jgi:phosphate transport system substrate-binding protein
MLNGGGATLPYPIYCKWFDEYHKLNPDIRINYQGIGSGGGIRQFTAETVDFGASDGPLSDAEMSSIERKFHHIPTVLGGVVPAFNLPGIKELNFNGDVLAGIYLGDIKNWNDKEIQKLNPGVKLPDAEIVAVHRSDGSGTTYCFTDYLSSISPDWKSRVGKNISVNWPGGIGGKGSEGVSGLIQRTPNSIGYMELLYAKQNDLSYGAVQNKSGQFVKADLDSVRAAAAAVKMPADFRVSIVNAPGEKSYPISTYTWLLVYDKNKDPQTGAVLSKLLTWVLTDGQAIAPKMDYAPLPDDVIAMVRKAVSQIQ